MVVAAVHAEAAVGPRPDEDRDIRAPVGPPSIAVAVGVVAARVPRVAKACRGPWGKKTPQQDHSTVRRSRGSSGLHHHMKRCFSVSYRHKCRLPSTISADDGPHHSTRRSGGRSPSTLRHPRPKRPAGSHGRLIWTKGLLKLQLGT